LNDSSEIKRHVILKHVLAKGIKSSKNSRSRSGSPFTSGSDGRSTRVGSPYTSRSNINSPDRLLEED
jgi:hypothetical protein